MTGYPQRHSGDRPSAMEQLSAVMDGEAGDDALQEACAAWRDQTHVREEWHLYHLIGDAMRSDDLCSGAAHDGRFLLQLRTRLEQEPSILAPAPLASSRRRAGRARWRVWSGSAAVAAGFVAVAGVLMVTQVPEAVPDPFVQTFAAALGPGGAANVGVAAAPQALPPRDAPIQQASTAAPDTAPPLVTDLRILRDARVEQYLDAHKQFGGSMALARPTSFLRPVTTQDAPSR